MPFKALTRCAPGQAVVALSLSLMGCAGPAISTPPPEITCAVIPQRLIADIPEPLLQGPTESDAVQWEARLIEAIRQANQRLEDARQYQRQMNTQVEPTDD